MKVEVLISCMYQEDASIIRKTNIQSDVLVINQCDENKIENFDFKNKKGEVCHARMIYTTERGLSRSRNMAISNAMGDICLLCDDDEELFDNYPEDIVNAYLKHECKSVIAFAIKRSTKVDSDKPMKIGYINALRISSFQISFKLDDIKNGCILFDETMGSGTGNGSGEENKFLYDCLKSGMELYYVPINIGKLFHKKSQWFNGYTNQFFYNRGFSSRKIMGVFFAIFYILYYTVCKYPRYKSENTFLNALVYQLRGLLKVC